MRAGTAVKVFKYSYISDLRATIFVKCPENGVKMGKNAPSTSKKVFKYSYINYLQSHTLHSYRLFWVYPM